MKEKDAIIRLSNQRGRLNPEAVEILSLEFASPLYYFEHQLRHPFGIYNVSLNRVFSSFENFWLELSSAKQHDIRSNKTTVKWDENLLYNLEKLLYSLMEHMEDCESIIKCFFPPGIKLNQEASFKNYQSAVNSYRTHIGKVVNHLKHNQGRLRSLGMFINDVPHLGYFVEGLSEDGSIGPAPHIHSNGTTAFSYARDIRYHLYNVYYVSSKLSKAISEISTPDKNKVAFQITEKNINLEKILYQITQLPMVVFVDEIDKNFPVIAIEKAENVVKLIATMKRHPYGIRTASGRTPYVAFYKTDGVSRTFRVPYGK